MLLMCGFFMSIVLSLFGVVTLFETTFKCLALNTIEVDDMFKLSFSFLFMITALIHFDLIHKKYSHVFNFILWIIALCTIYFAKSLENDTTLSYVLYFIGSVLFVNVFEIFLRRNDEAIVGETRPLETNKQLDMIILFGIIRKSGIELSINISHTGVVYSFSNEKPFNQENWNKSLLGFIDEKIITIDEADIYNKFINSIRGIESLGVLIEKLRNDPKRDDEMTEKMITLLSSVQEKK